jgi:hypothetical protein
MTASAPTTSSWRRRAELSVGDIILAAAGAPVTVLGDFYTRLWAQGPAGDTIPLRIQRDRMCSKWRSVPLTGPHCCASPDSTETGDLRLSPEGVPVVMVDPGRHRASLEGAPRARAA